MKKENWVWMPHAGHFILGNSCRFHLSTYVGKYIVSTVGELWNERSVREIHADTYDKEWFDKNKHLKGKYFDNAYFKKFGYDDVGFERTYETMVFKARRNKENPCCPWSMVNSGELDFMGYKEAGEAYKGHMFLCKKWSVK